MPHENLLSPPAAQVAGDTPAIEQSPPAPDGPRTDGSGNTPQLDLADNTVDRNKMIPSSNREHGRGEPYMKITNSNKKHEHVPHEPHKKIASSNKKQEHVPREFHKKIASSDTKDDHEIREPGSGESYSLHRTVTLADGPRTDQLGSTPQLDLADNTVDRNQMIPSSNREHGSGEPHKKITSSNKKQEHVPHEPHKKIASSNKKQEHVPRELHKKIASSDTKDDHEIREPGSGESYSLHRTVTLVDGPRTDGSRSTPQLDLADNTVDRNQMIPSSNREQGRGEPHKKITSSNKKQEHVPHEPHKKIASSNKKQEHVPRELHKKIDSSDTKDDHEIREPGSGESYSLHRTVTLADGPRTDQLGSTPQLDLADNTVDRNQMIPSSNREHGRGEPHKKITSSNKKQEHVPHEPHKKIASSNKKQEHVPRELHKKIASSDTKDDHEIREPGSGESYSLHRTVTLVDGPRTDQLGSTPQLDLADNTVDRNQMIPSSNREHGSGEPLVPVRGTNRD
ncbi:semenogelin-1-like [Hordeum vulgare subsp. vulgare]|uniref:semenogelin-1-like n=1 Tax=Hordeum vulgare subsp. vulgare TaxID=112509 RepID=UPI001D1A5516|nr:semenogelin-1-like [Hordeum vulgare subsp. vulgare]